MQPQIIFAEEIYIDKLDIIDCDKLKEKILDIRSQSDGVQISNVLGWQSGSLNDKSPEYKHFSRFGNTIVLYSDPKVFSTQSTF